MIKLIIILITILLFKEIFFIHKYYKILIGVNYILDRYPDIDINIGGCQSIGDIMKTSCYMNLDCYRVNFIDDNTKQWILFGTITDELTYSYLFDYNFKIPTSVIGSVWFYLKMRTVNKKVQSIFYKSVYNM